MKYELKEAVVVNSRAISLDLTPSGANKGFPLGNQFQVRVLPEMVDIEEENMLPIYPNFFLMNQIGYQQDERVWLFCTEDFQAGFILGRMQSSAGSELSSLVEILNTAEQNAGFPLSGYNDLTIENPAGKSFRFFNERTGSSGVIYNNKTVYLYGPNGEMWVNNPGMTGYVSPDGDMKLEGKSLSEDYTSDITTTAQGNSSETAASKRIETSGMVTISAGGSLQEIVGSNKAEMVVGDSQEVVAGQKSETFGKGYTLLVGPGGITITSPTTITITTVLGIIINGPIIASPAATAIPTGTGAFCALKFDPFSGAPLTTNIYPGV